MIKLVNFRKLLINLKKEHSKVNNNLEELIVKIKESIMEVLTY